MGNAGGVSEDVTDFAEFRDEYYGVRVSVHGPLAMGYKLYGKIVRQDGDEAIGGEMLFSADIGQGLHRLREALQASMAALHRPPAACRKKLWMGSGTAYVARCICVTCADHRPGQGCRSAQRSRSTPGAPFSRSGESAPGALFPLGFGAGGRRIGGNDGVGSALFGCWPCAVIVVHSQAGGGVMV